MKEIYNTSQLQTINSPTKRYLQKKASKLLVESRFRDAFVLFERAFWIDENDLETRIGLYLCDIGMDFGAEAISIYELYQSMLAYTARKQKSAIQKGILHLISVFDDRMQRINSKRGVIEKLEYENAILYSDFKKILKNRDFKDAFTGLVFSTKIIFTKKSDFYEFLLLLIENDYLEISMSYIDSLPEYDIEVSKILEIARKKQASCRDSKDASEATEEGA